MKNMKLLKIAVAGTLESSDIMITIEPTDTGGIVIDLNSPVEKQYGHQIKKCIKKTMEELGVEHVQVRAIDKGALDCTIAARVKTAALRSGEATEKIWEELMWNRKSV